MLTNLKVHRDEATAKKRHAYIHILTVLSEDKGQHFSYRSVDTHMGQKEQSIQHLSTLGNVFSLGKGKLNMNLFYQLQYFRLLIYIYILHIIYIKDQKVFKLIIIEFSQWKCDFKKYKNALTESLKWSETGVW